MKKYILILLASTVLALTSNAQVTFQSFQIANNYVENNNLKVTNTNAATPFKFLFALTRGIQSTGGYQPGTCKISLIYTEYQSSDSHIEKDPSEVLLYSKNVSSSDYKNSSQALFKDVEASLPANKQNGRILIRYEYSDTQNIARTEYSTTRYGIYLVPPPVVTTITNNIISLHDNGVNSLAVIGTTPKISSGERYTNRYEIKDINGGFVEVPENGTRFSGDNNGAYVEGIIATGGTYRRVVTLASGLYNYSNEITVPKTQKTVSNLFTIIKKEAFNNNGLLIGNTIKIVLEKPDPNIRFSAMLFGPNDPYYVPVNKDYEFFLPLYYKDGLTSDPYPFRDTSIGLLSNSGNSLRVTPTWK